MVDLIINSAPFGATEISGHGDLALIFKSQITLNITWVIILSKTLYLKILKNNLPKKIKVMRYKILGITLL